MTVERVTLIRHGRTAWNAAGRWQGFEAVPLDDVGFSQARALAAYWQQPLTALYTSDLLRAWQTAAVLGESLGLKPQADERLREFNLGIFQGLTFDEIKRIHPLEADKMRDDYMGYTVPQGETRRALQARAYAAFSDIVADGSGHVAIVSHGGTIKVLPRQSAVVPPAAATTPQKSASPSPPPTGDSATATETITMTQNGGGYSPSVLTVHAGSRVRWVITSTDAYTCASALRVPSLGISKQLAAGENVIEFIPDKEGNIPFNCSMGMYRGTINVLPRPT